MTDGDEENFGGQVALEKDPAAWNGTSSGNNDKDDRDRPVFDRQKIVADHTNACNPLVEGDEQDVDLASTDGDISIDALEGQDVPRSAKTVDAFITEMERHKREEARLHKIGLSLERTGAPFIAKALCAVRGLPLDIEEQLLAAVKPMKLTQAQNAAVKFCCNRLRRRML